MKVEEKSSFRVSFGNFGGNGDGVNFRVGSDNEVGVDVSDVLVRAMVDAPHIDVAGRYKLSVGGHEGEGALETGRALANNCRRD